MTPVVIPLGDIAAKATETSTFLINLAMSTAQSAQDQNIANSVPVLSKRLDERLGQAVGQRVQGLPNHGIQPRQFLSVQRVV